jgi:hypothetical protein
MKDELPIAINTPALVMLIVSVIVENSEAISSVADSREVLE